MRKLILVLWRAWFYFLCTVPVLILFIPLAFFVTIPNGYKYLFWIARNIWSPFVLFGMGFRIKRLNSFPGEIKSTVIVANHSSYIDIMLMFRMRKTPFVFVGKKELTKIPFFGYLYRKAAITVDRSSSESRKKVYESAKRVIEKGYSICIFPEKDYLDEMILLNTFKKGAFKLAIEHQLPIFPIIFYDCKRKFPWHTHFGHVGSLRVKALELVDTKDMTYKDIDKLSLVLHKKIKDHLLSDTKKNSINAIELWRNRTPH